MTVYGGFFIMKATGIVRRIDELGRVVIPKEIRRTLRLGVELGEFDGKIFKPAHALAMSVKREEIKRFVALSPEECERYLSGETLTADIENGWCVVGFDKYPLGLAKAVNGTLKNHLPKGLRK